MIPRNFAGAVVTRYPGTLGGVHDEFLRDIYKEIHGRFARVMTEMYDLRKYEFYKEDMLDYLEGHRIHTVDDSTLDDEDVDIVIMLLPDYLRKISPETRQFISDLDDRRHGAASLAERLTRLAAQWTDVNVPLARGRTLVLHPAAENGLAVGRRDRAYFANLLAGAEGPGDVVPAKTAAHVRITVATAATYEAYRDDAEPKFPSCRDNIACVQFGSRRAYFPVDFKAALELPGDAGFRLTPAACARHLAPALYELRLAGEWRA